MHGRKLGIAVAGAALLGLLAPAGLNAAEAGKAFSLSDLAAGQPRNVVVTQARVAGRQAVEIRPAKAASEGEMFVTLPGSEFHDGEITADIAAEALPGAEASVRAFAGLGFRATSTGYEAFYLRMLNGRAADQLQRNHAAQYISHPDYGWARLRKETPGLYESYVDLQPGAWTAVRIVVCGADAALYVGGASQPTLVVHDLKRGGDARGALLLWVGPGTSAAFTNVKVKPATSCDAGAAKSGK